MSPDLRLNKIYNNSSVSRETLTNQKLKNDFGERKISLP
jgi:hypothetical protein